MDNPIDITTTEIINVAVSLKHSGREVAANFLNTVATLYDDQQKQIRSLTIENAELLLIIDAQHEMLKCILPGEQNEGATSRVQESSVEYCQEARGE